MYSKIERSDLRVKREQIQVIENVLQTNAGELLSLRFATQVNTIISTEKHITKRVLELTNNTINYETELQYYAKNKVI
ncbi:MAG: hypothetical protein KBG33_07230 [Paludibacteraceae bacterium]|jgi:hypothetical protein|nr:hypothetical protein [Paludibacteraceae bacterium]